MKTIEEALNIAYDECKSNAYFGNGFKKGVEFAQEWISVDTELPETPLTDIENVQYSEYILLKVNGYDHPFIGYYVKANEDEFFEFFPESITNEFMQELITHWRPIEYK